MQSEFKSRHMVQDFTHNSDLIMKMFACIIDSQ